MRSAHFRAGLTLLGTARTISGLAETALPF